MFLDWRLEYNDGPCLVAPGILIVYNLYQKLTSELIQETDARGTNLIVQMLLWRQFC